MALNNVEPIKTKLKTYTYPPVIFVTLDEKASNKKPLNVCVLLSVFKSGVTKENTRVDSIFNHQKDFLR